MSRAAEVDPVGPPVCKACGAEMERVQCESCEDGYTAPGELYEMDPLWYDEDDSEPCHGCHGVGGWWACFGRCYDEERERMASRERES